MTQPTNGPWYTKREGFSTVYVMASIGGGWTQEVAACGPTEKGKDQQEANARLISAAPDLLEALRCAAQSAGFQYMTHETRELIDAALAKATGSQP